MERKTWDRIKNAAKISGGIPDNGTLLDTPTSSANSPDFFSDQKDEAAQVRFHETRLSIDATQKDPDIYLEAVRKHNPETYREMKAQAIIDQQDKPGKQSKKISKEEAIGGPDFWQARRKQVLLSRAQRDDRGHVLNRQDFSEDELEVVEHFASAGKHDLPGSYTGIGGRLWQTNRPTITKPLMMLSIVMHDVKSLRKAAKGRSKQMKAVGDHIQRSISRGLAEDVMRHNRETGAGYSQRGKHGGMFKLSRSGKKVYKRKGA